jgi:hypothetical protein
MILVKERDSTSSRATKAAELEAAERYAAEIAKPIR